MTLQEIQKQVTELSGEELKTFSAWLDEYLADEWDRQIERDAQNGNLDRLVKHLGIDFENNPTEPLAEGAISRVTSPLSLENLFPDNA